MSSSVSFSRKVLPYLALVVLGFMIVVTASTVRPGPRLPRRERLVDLIAREDARTRALRAQVDELQTQLLALEAAAGEREVRIQEVQSRLGTLRTAAGLEPVAGPGVHVELRDSTLRESPTGDPNDLVIHEQDLQAVVNALWDAGAEAMTVNDERITSGSAVRCVGNTLLLHGSVYAPPYRVAAVGNQATLLRGLQEDPLVERFRIFAAEFKLGFDTQTAARLSLPAFQGVVSNNTAEISA